MSSHDVKMFSNTEFNFKTLQEVLIALENENIIMKKMQYLEHIVSNYLMELPDANIEADFLHIFMPQAKSVLEKIFEKTIEIAYETNDAGDVCKQTLELLQEHLQMVIMLFDRLAEIFNFVIARKDIDFSYVTSLPLYATQILYLTFLHCKESNNIYKNYFESLNEILIVFKKAQDVHSKLLNLLENCLVYNVSRETEITLLSNVLDNLAEIGDVLSDMNVKSMADNWKSYMNLTQKYAQYLDKYLSLDRPLLFCTTEIVKSLNNILENLCDSKNIVHTLKISNFILRVMIKLCDTFSTKVRTHMEIFWNFFIDFYSAYYPGIKNKQFSENTSDLVKSLICNGLEQLLNELIKFREFYDVQLFESLTSKSDSSLGFLLVSNKVLQNLVLNQNNQIHGINVAQYLDAIFTAMTKCYILLMKEDRIYEELLLSVIHLTSLSTNEQFSQIEHILCRNLLSSFVWNSLFAYDVWCLISKTCSLKYRFNLLLWIVESFRDLLQLHYTMRPQFTILGNFVRELYHTLDTNHKLLFINKYPLCTNYLHIWKYTGMKWFPNPSLMQAENLLNCMCDMMEKYDMEKSTYEEFLTMVDIMRMFATIPFDEVYFDLKRTNTLLQRLWDFSGTNRTLFESSIFRLFLESMSNLTINLLWRLKSTELIEILNQLKEISNCDTTLKSLLLFVIKSILHNSSDFSQEQQTTLALASELLSPFLTDENVIVKIEALEMIQEVSNNRIWNDICQKNLKKNAQAQTIISNCTNRKATNVINTLSTYIMLERTQFQHECLINIPLGPILKKMKKEQVEECKPPELETVKTVTENVEITRLLQKIRKDVQYIGKSISRSDLTEQNIKDVNFILKELQGYS